MSQVVGGSIFVISDVTCRAVQPTRRVVEHDAPT